MRIELFKLNPSAKIINIDLAIGMLRALREIFSENEPELIAGSFFCVPLGCEIFDAMIFYLTESFQ